MSVRRTQHLGPASTRDLEDPAFLAFLRERFPGRAVEPEDVDFERPTTASTSEELARRYRRAQARRLVRLYRQWKETALSADPPKRGN